MDKMSSFSYCRLRNDEAVNEEAEERAVQRIKRLLRFRKVVILRRRVKLRVRGYRKFRNLRKRSNFFRRVKDSWGKAMKRLRNGQIHLNDLLAGNFLMMQANPNHFMCRGERRNFMGHHGLAPSVGKIA